MTKKVKVESGALSVLLLIATMIWFFHFRSAKPSGSSALSVVASYKAMAVENPHVHWDRVVEARQTEYQTVGRDIFTGGLPPPPPAPVVQVAPVEVHDTAPPPPPPPPPPHLPLKYFGYGALESGPGRRAFLTDGDAVYIVAEGDTVLSRFRVIRITHSSLEFEELGTSRHGVTVLEDQRATP
jgi:hypothetical protein